MVVAGTGVALPGTTGCGVSSEASCSITGGPGSGCVPGGRHPAGERPSEGSPRDRSHGRHPGQRLVLPRPLPTTRSTTRQQPCLGRDRALHAHRDQAHTHLPPALPRTPASSRITQPPQEPARRARPVASPCPLTDASSCQVRPPHSRGVHVSVVGPLTTIATRRVMLLSVAQPCNAKPLGLFEFTSNRLRQVLYGSARPRGERDSWPGGGAAAPVCRLGRSPL